MYTFTFTEEVMTVISSGPLPDTNPVSLMIRFPSGSLYIFKCVIGPTPDKSSGLFPENSWMNIVCQ